MKTKMIITFSLLGIFSLSLVAQNNSIDYFGQTPPGDSAVIFAPGIISLTDRLEGSAAFSPDSKEFYFEVWGPEFSSCKIYYTKRVSNKWTEQVEAPFSVNHYTGGLFCSADGNRIYFNYSYIDKPNDIWMIERTTEGWSDPKLLPSPINSASSDNCYTETADGISYIASNRPGGLDKHGDIWCIHRLTDHSLKAENLGPIVNSIYWDSSPCIAPDGSYLIFTSERPGGHGRGDLYVSFKNANGDWIAPVNLDRINISAYEGDATLSPDGRFLFFNRSTRTGTEEKKDVYWVSTKVINDIKKEVLNPKITK